MTARWKTQKAVLMVLIGLASVAAANDAVFPGVGAPCMQLGSITTGWQFTPDADIRVTKLALWQPAYWNGFKESHPICIWLMSDPDNPVVVASGTVDAGLLPADPDAGGYVYVSPDQGLVTLHKDSPYIIAAFWDSDQDAWVWSPGAGYWNDPSIKTTASGSSGYLVGAFDVPTTWVSSTYWSANFKFEPVPTTIPVLIDIKPGTDPNPINQGSNGVIPVAILTTPEFDAGDVDPASVILNEATVAVRGKSQNLLARMEDVDGDGDVDLVCQVDTECWEELFVDGYVTLSGQTYGGMAIEGEDYVIVVPPLP